jgi:hypothetical protein
MRTNRLIVPAAIILAFTTASCSTPGADSLKDSFAEQLAANEFVRDFKRSGDELTFSGPGAEGGTATWRVRIDSTVVEANSENTDTMPYKGTVKSSWFSDGQPVEPSGGESRLPIELTSNGLSQDCWAFWDNAAERWSWE